MLPNVDDGNGAVPDHAVSALGQGPHARSFAPRLPVLICFSHLRWEFVYQRPQHLISRFARTHRVYYFEEPVYDGIDGKAGWLEQKEVGQDIIVVTPHLPCTSNKTPDEQQRLLIDELLSDSLTVPSVLWYYTPMSVTFSDHIAADVIVYDCMDELSAFRGAPAEMVAREGALFDRADVVFTGGASLFKAKRRLHSNVHLFPSSVDLEHFRRARSGLKCPEDQSGIGLPRLGFYGVIDERFDGALVAKVAHARPDWQLIFIGPVAKIDPACLPQAPNIHFLGARSYDQLPAYLAGWDVSLMPFLINEATRFISPTKTPEYLAAGRPVVSTPIYDVVQAYGGCPMVHIAEGASAFVAGCEAALASTSDRTALAHEADRALAGMSWDQTWDAMTRVMRKVVRCGATALEGDSLRVAARRGDPGTGIPAAKSFGFSVGFSTSDQPRECSGRGYDYLVVGAGFAGSVLAERLAADSGKRVLIIDKRPHIGGNAYDALDAAGVLVHRYGPHIFHTNAPHVVDYLSRFTDWRPYEHRVLAAVDGLLVPMPINLRTLSMLFGKSFTSQQADGFLKAQAVSLTRSVTAEDAVVSQIGRELYQKFFQGYTRKQWGLDPRDLDASVTARVPARLSHDDRHFTDSFQAMPARGYTRMFEKMLAHPLIDVRLNTDYRDIREDFPSSKVIYTGPVDEYFDHCFGPLPYRSLRFHHETLDQETFQPAAVVNYPDPSVPYTRITEYKYLTGQHHSKTSLTYEYPTADGDPYYPIPRPENAALYKRYQALGDQTQGVLFVGRLGTYRYYNMDQVVAQALAAYSRIKSLAGRDSPAAQAAAA